MIRFARMLVLVGLVLPAVLKAEEQGKNLVLRAWAIPLGFVTKVDPSSKTGDRKVAEGFARTGTPHVVQYDASEFLRAHSVQLPAGSEAIFDEEASMLIVRTDPENLDLLEAILGGCTWGYPTNLMVEIVSYECALPANDGLESNWPTFSELSALPAADIVPMGRLSITTKSGRKVPMRQIEQTSGSHTKPQPTVDEKVDAEGWEQFSEGECGTIISVEPIIGPDAISIDLNINYRLRMPEVGGSFSEVSFTTEVSTRDAMTVVVYVAKSPRSSDKYLVVTANVRVDNDIRWHLKDAGEKAE